LSAGVAANAQSGRGKQVGPPPGPVTHLPDGKPDIQGIWDAKSGAPAFDIEDHPTAQFGIPAGKGVIVDPPDGHIPYQPWAAEKRKDLLEHHMFGDPEAHCTLSGVPRQMYAPFGFQIFQPPGYVVIFFEAFHSFRIIPLDGRPHPPDQIKLFEGDSRGHWEGNTLVVDVTNQNGDTWFDMAGNFHSDAIHVVERLTPTNSDTIRYEATIEDPKVYTRPWKMAFDFGRNKQPGFELMEFACIEGEQDLKHYVGSEGGAAK
jgi:hypothetical protein